MVERRVLLACIPVAIGAVVVIAWPRLLGHGWLAALFFWSAVPVGSIGYLLVMRLVGGRWREALAPAMIQATASLPISAIAAVPILIAMAALYPWVSDPQDGFRGIWLSPLPFVMRALVWFAGLAAILYGLARDRRSQAVATAGLLFLFPMGSLIAVDWLMSLAPDFHSSGFGLQALEIQFTIALMIGVLRAPPDSSGTIGALMLTLLMLWGYFAYLPFFIVWSGNAPAGAAWYLARDAGGWGVVALIAVLLHAGPLLALLSPTVRRSARVLRALALVVLIGDALQAAWLVLPVDGPVRVAGLLAFGGALLLLGGATMLAGRRS